MDIIKKASEEKAKGVILAIGLISIALIFYPTTKSFVSVWLSESSIYSHGVLLPFIIVFIIYREWNISGKNLAIHSRYLIIVLLILLSILWLIAYLTQTQVVTQIAYVFIMIAYLIGLFGYKKTGYLVFPLLLLLTSVPIWSVFSDPLRIPTAYAVNKLLHITGYTSMQEGSLIHIPEGTFKVSDVCSGINNQIAAILLSLLLAYYYRLRVVGLLILTLLGSIVAFISNSIRIYIVVLSGHYTQMQHSLLHDHIWLGWLVFSVVYTLFAYMVSRVLEPKSSGELSIQRTSEANSISLYTRTAVLLMVAAAFGPIITVALQVVNNKKPENIQFDLPLRVNEWSMTNQNVTAWKPLWLKPDLTEIRQYQNTNGSNFDVYFAYYAEQFQGKELVNSENRVFDQNKWRILNSRLVDISGSDNKVFNVRELIITNSEGIERIVWKWYMVGGKSTAKDIKAKLFGLQSAFKGKTDAVVIIISTEIKHSYSETRENMGLFTTELEKKFESL